MPLLINQLILIATRGNAEVSLTWIAPIITGGSPITDYIIEFSTDGSSWTVINDGPGTGTTTTVTGLTNGEIYSFRVSAVNAIGTGTPSLVVIATPATIPDAPVTFVGIRGDTQVSLSWMSPSSNGDSITDYLVEFNDGSGWEIFQDGTSQLTTATVTGLTNGQSYDFRVSAINSVGSSLPSETISVTPATLSTPPLNPVAISGDTQVSLSWDIPADDGGEDIIDYIIQVSLDNTNWTVYTDGVDSATTATVTSLTNGQTYYLRILAENDVGVSVPSDVLNAIPATVPSNPTNLSATAGNTEVSLSWTAPLSTGGSPITDYLVEFSADAGDTWNTFADGTSTATAATVDNLTNGQSYTFRVSTTNSVGTGISSDSVTSIPATVSTKPLQLSATAGDTTISLSWSVPLDDGGSPIIDYVIEYRLPGDTWITFDDGVSTATTVTVTDLINGSLYQFRVYAVNDIGVSNSSNVATARPSTISNAPSDLIAIAISSTIIDLSWTAPLDTGGELITGYQIERQIGTGAFEIIISDTETTSTLFSDIELTAGTSYTYRVAAITATGLGAASGTAGATTFDLPTIPTNLTAVGADAEVTLTWTAPSDGGSPITDYLIEYRADSGQGQGSWIVFDDSTSSLTSATVTGLSNGQSYDFRVSAINSVGQGPLSDVVSATPIAGSDPPTNLTATAGDTLVSLSWTAPLDDGGSPITDYLVEYSLDGVKLDCI